MKRWLLTAGFSLGALLPLEATAASFTRMYSFGDSLSDDGNLFDLTFGLLPRPPYQQRFSNGPVWAEYFAEDLELELTNLAVGGARTGRSHVAGPFFPLGLTTQIDFFLATTAQLDGGGLYTLWAGANDYINGSSLDATEPVNNLVSAIDRLILAGAENLAVFNLPDLGQLPGSQASGRSAELTQAAASHNAQLQAALEPRAEVTLIDVDALFDAALAGGLGFGNVTDSCLTDFSGLVDFSFSICSQPDSYLFWDDLHPTTEAHRRISEFAQSQLLTPPPATLTPSPALAMVSVEGADSVAVPEPGVIFAVMGIGLALVGARRP